LKKFIISGITNILFVNIPPFKDKLRIWSKNNYDLWITFKRS